MLNNNLLGIVQLMQVMAQGESRIAEFYKTCAESFPLNKEFWAGLAREEEGHAAIIERVTRAATEEPEMFEPGELSPLEALQAFLLRLDDKFELLKEGRLTEHQALFVAYLIENTFAEHSFAGAIRSKEPSFVTNLEQLTSESVEHRTRVVQMFTNRSRRA
jgi:hypothetical protein